MPITRKNTPLEVEMFIKEAIRRKEALIIRNLKYLGEQCVNEAKKSNEYKDQTGNLRSSLGYLLLHDGLVITTGGFKPIKGAITGSNAGEDFAKSLISKNMSGFVLIIVAGMNYAAHVEATNRDVLTSAELFAHDRAPVILKSLGLLK